MLLILLFFGKKFIFTLIYTPLLWPTRLKISKKFPSKPDLHLLKWEIKILSTQPARLLISEKFAIYTIICLVRVSTVPFLSSLSHVKMINYPLVFFLVFFPLCILTRLSFDLSNSIRHWKHVMHETIFLDALGRLLSFAFLVPTSLKFPNIYRIFHLRNNSHFNKSPT